MTSLMFALLLALAGCGGESAEGAQRGVRATAVAAVPVLRDDLLIEATFPGELFSDAAELSARTAGVLRSVDVRIGDRVKQGQVLARVQDDLARQELAEARALLMVAQANVTRASTDAELAARDQERIVPLVERKLATDQEADAARARVQTTSAELAVARARVEEARARVARLEEQLQNTRVVAPFEGVVAARYVDPGTVVQVGAPLLRVVADEPLRVRFQVPEHQVMDVRAGMSLQILASDLTVPGTVERLAGEVSRSDRSLAAEGIVEGGEGLRPGMFARVRVQLQRLDDALVVPGIAVLDRIGPDGAPIDGVFIATDGVARWVRVDTIGREGDRVAVSGDLEEHDLVLVLGHESLVDGAPIRLPEEP